MTILPGLQTGPCQTGGQGDIFLLNIFILSYILFGWFSPRNTLGIVCPWKSSSPLFPASPVLDFSLRLSPPLSWCLLHPPDLQGDDEGEFSTILLSCWLPETVYIHLVIGIIMRLTSNNSISGESRNSCSRPLPGMKTSDSHSQIMGMDFFISFPFPNFGNAFVHSFSV